MASNKVRSKNDTWTTEELQMALKEEKSNKKDQDMASRRKQLREEEEREARKLKESRKVKRAEQNAKSRTLIDEDEHRQRRRETKAKEGNAPDEDEERRRRRHERKLKDGNMDEYKMEEEQKRRRHERKLKEAKEKDEEEQKRRRHERKLKEAKEEEELRQKKHDRKSKVKKIIANLEEEEEERRRRRHEKKKEEKEREKDDEERIRKKHERKLKEAKLAEEDDEERRRKRHEKKSKQENQEDEDENDRRRRRHEKKSKDRNVGNKDDEERLRKRHERKLKEAKLAEENAEEMQHNKREHHSKKASEKTNQNVSRQEMKSELDKNLNEFKKTKKSKHNEHVNNENDKQQERMAKVDIKPSPTPPTDLLERKVSDESVNEDKYNYDEDFENYSDDFDNDDDDDNSASENSSSRQEKSFHEDVKNTDHSYLSSADSCSRESAHMESAHISSAEKSSSSVNERSTYQVMDFSHTKLRKMTPKVKNKLQSRSDDLSSLIALDVSIGQEVFELAPISEYELYIRNFGKANSSQVYVQTGHDNVDRDIQTEEIERLDKWTQHPPNGPAVCGGNDDKNLKPTDFVAKSQLQDSTRLNKFLLQATQMISILLEEDFSTSSHDLTPEKSSQMPFSKSFFTLSSCPLFQDYTIDCCCFANSLHADYILTVHNPPDDKNKEKKRTLSPFLGSYVALWDLRTPSRPYKILYSESTINCCFGSLKSQLVLAGCVDGAVVVWDLRESESLHKHVNFEDMNFCVRYPSYNTASVLSFDSHCNIIQTIRDIPLQIGRQKETLFQKESFNSGYTCQLLSMDQSGLINLWVIVEVPSIDSSGSQVDLGLSPGSRIKLEYTSSINVHTAVRESLFSTSINAQQLCLLPKDPNQIYLSTDTGHIIHSVRLGSQPYPRVHCPRKVTPSSGVLIRVLSLDFSPFMAPCFLTGHSDGSVNLYHTSLECPVVTWLPSQTVTKSIWSVRWSQSRPTVFYVCDDSSTVFVFDLLEQDNTPVCTNTYEERLSSFNVICNTNDNNHTEKMILCFANGRIEVHHISDRFSECQTLEMDFLENYLHRM